MRTDFDGEGTLLLFGAYPEGALVHLAKALPGLGASSVIYLPSRKFSIALSRLLRPGSRTRLRERISRDSDSLPARYLAPWLELLRVLGRIFEDRSVPLNVMDVVKRGMDKRVARLHQKWPHDVRALVGMPGSCERTFAIETGALRVFHAVDAHPAHARRVLEQAYGRRARKEFPSKRRTRQIQRELKLADLVLVPSRLVASQMIAEGVPEDRVFTIPYGVDTSRFAPSMLDEKPESQGEPDSPRLLYVGQISYRKGIPDLLEAVSQLNLTLSMVGPVVAHELVEKLPRNVTHIPAVAPSELRAIMADSDAFVFPSLEDAFGFVLTEAMACGLPVIATAATGSAQLVTPADGAVISAGDVGALRKELERVRRLSILERRENAARFRRRIDQGEVLDWEGYASAVLDRIRRQLKAHSA